MRALCISMLAAVTAASAGAQSALPAAEPIPRATYLGIMDAEFGKMDANKDNALTRPEAEQFERAAALSQARARNQAMFAQLDSDRSGQLSAAEFAKLAIAPPPPNAGPLIAQHDLNKDGSISLVEYRTVKLANFDRIDADKDGVASAAEMKAAGVIK